jgi:hypothetical protein
MTHQVDEIAKNAINIDQPSGRPIPIRDIYRWRLSDVMFNKNNPNLSHFPNKDFFKCIIEFVLEQMDNIFLHSPISFPTQVVQFHCPLFTGIVIIKMKQLTTAYLNGIP